MKNLTKLLFAGTAMLGLAMAGQAQAEPDYPFAATAYFGGGGSWLDTTTLGPIIIGGDDERDIASIVGGGDIVLPVNGYWNAQLGGSVLIEHEHVDAFFGSFSNTNTQAQFNTLGFWRNPDMGVFGLELGILSPFEGGLKYLKTGGVAEYFFGDMATVGAFGGALVPFGRGLETVDTGFYAGGHITYYASQNLAFAGFARYTHEEFNPVLGVTLEDERLTAGGKVRYLTSMPGVEVYGSAAYTKCEFSVGGVQAINQLTRDEGVEVMAGIKIRLGGHSDSLVNIDRSNAIDTRAWVCG